MKQFNINHDIIDNEFLPSFSILIEGSYTSAIYSDIDKQTELVKELQNKSFSVFNQQEGLYERLTVEANITFFHKWFGCEIPIPEILVIFELQNCAKTSLYKCSKLEIRRVYYAKYFISGVKPMIFHEPIQGMDIKTINTFIKMLEIFKEQDVPALVLVSNMEHALLLGDVAYKLQEKGIQKIEVEENRTTENTETTLTQKLFKISAKVDDKIILFDPFEIDYIESQEGKAMIVINNETYAMDSTLGDIEKKLDIYGFYRCHRSYIVNLQKVREIITWSKNTYSLRIDNNTNATIPLSRTKVKEIQDKFSLK